MNYKKANVLEPIKLLLIFTVLYSCTLKGQNITRQELKDTLQNTPYFTIHKDNYFITGVPTNKAINSNTANAKYQISFKQLITKNVLPWETYLFLTYSQKAFWDIYKDSYPFTEINFNPTIGLGKAFFDKNNRLKGFGSFFLEHESNGRDSIYSRSWNRLSLKYSTNISPKTILTVKGWIPFSYKAGNSDLLDYVGLGEVTASHDFIRNKLIFEIKARKGLKWDLKGLIRSRFYYRPFKHNSNQYIMLEWFAGYTENLIDYDQFTSMVRVGYVIKTNELDFLKGKDSF
ncbi:phospholipase A [Cellulophaga baltica]|uniref:phospholipase A n=1 Tax=Cellulophaga TaxID=104264 RepID=UPI001C0726B5|nr:MULTISPECIES: phospholipase A [Cellulophaga]MBU2996999.1 phospholipase A [Cellulophaga baltica]MDO6768397.1 phospholipase A [Cellulophaga sp. 1_MG-2023]